MKTTLCYIESQGRYLMMLRNKKDHDVNQGKYVGVGGKFLPGETPDECLLREVREETGFKLTEFSFRGVVRFVSDTWEDEDMYLYTATGFEAPAGMPWVEVPALPLEEEGGQVVHSALPEGGGCQDNAVVLPLPECSEGSFEWVAKTRVEDLPTWEGDKYFLRALAAGVTDIAMTLEYQGDALVRVSGIDCLKQAPNDRLTPDNVTLLS